jgi:septum formation inhibitor-activating ATPase MinD
MSRLIVITGGSDGVGAGTLTVAFDAGRQDDCLRLQ